MSKYKLYKADFNFSLLFVSEKAKLDLKEEALSYLSNDLENPSALFHDNVSLTEITSVTQVPKDLKDYGIWGEHEYVEGGGVNAAEFLDFIKDEKEKESAEYKKYLELKKKFEPKTRKSK